MAHLAICGGHPIRTEPFPSWPVFDDRDKTALIQTLESAVWGIDSPAIDEFERKFAEFCGVKYAIACTNGTDAIPIALKALGIGPGDEVIIPPYTFIATGVGIIMANAVPVFADIHPETYNIDPESIEKAITPKTKAIMPVHIAGNPADMDMIMQIAGENHLYLIEDTAQAHGAEWKGQKVGTIGHIGTFSFQSSKNLASGEGGALVTDDEQIADRIRSFVNCGRIKDGEWYDHHEIAGNHRLSAYQAALLNVGLERLEEQMKTREKNADYLSTLLADMEGIKLTSKHQGTTRHGYHLGILRYHSSAFKGLPKTRFIEALEKEGIPCAYGYLPLYQFPCFKQFKAKVPAYTQLYEGQYNLNPHCPVCERICAEESVWLFQEMFLGTQKDMEDIAEAIRKIQIHADEAIQSKS